ncbi:MAG: hypothetical protein JOZ62_00095, partial [Acidobacteriaceae bacterium]|nr:hypothetical protein [Acidobacteriaceae bacterium]
CRLLVGPVMQFYWFWTPQYLFHARGLTLAEIGLFSWIPFLFGDIGSIGGGWIAGLLIRRGFTVNTARFSTMYFGAICCLLSIGVVTAATTASAIGFISLVLFGNTFLSANMFAAISDLVPRAAVGRVTGMTGIAGGLSGLTFPLVTGWLIDHVSYVPAFFIAALMPLAGVVVLHAVLGRIQARPTPSISENVGLSC